MCGIVGIVRQGNNDLHPELRDSIRRLSHRGPDDSGTWTTAKSLNDDLYSIGLGHVRLAIIDLSINGHQPMIGKDGSVIILNGEIYNYKELKHELAQSGHVFNTQTDTEVVSAAYKEWGSECVKRFIGMWAFAIWNDDVLFLSRDRLGKKPLYFYHEEKNGFLAFASEIKGLKNIRGVPWQPDERTAYRYLAFAETEKDGKTFYQDIKELPAGSFMLYRPGDKKIQYHRYWTMPDEQVDVDEREAVIKTTELLHDSIRLRLRSDAPLGLSLSGGLDSTLLLSMINELGYKDISVFSSGYIEKGYNETRYIDVATRYLSCRPSSTNTDSSYFKEDFDRIVYHLDQPSKLPGPYSQWRVAELAGRKVKVLFDGQGADELAGGYLYFIPVMWRNLTLRQKIVSSPDLFHTLLSNLQMFNQYPLKLIWERVSGKINYNRQLPLQEKWSSKFSEERPVWEKFENVNAMLRHAVTDSSLPALLRYSDRDNMAFGVENRCPFLDHRLVEYVSALPAELKIRGGATKWIFREVAKNRIPEAIYKRRLKMGFPTPFGEWLRKELLNTAREWLTTYGQLSLFNQWIDLQSVFDLLNEHATAKSDHQALLWRLLSIGCWLKTTGLDAGR